MPDKVLEVLTSRITLRALPTELTELISLYYTSFHIRFYSEHFINLFMTKRHWFLQLKPLASREFQLQRVNYIHIRNHEKLKTKKFTINESLIQVLWQTYFKMLRFICIYKKTKFRCTPILSHHHIYFKNEETKKKFFKDPPIQSENCLDFSFFPSC